MRPRRRRQAPEPEFVEAGGRRLRYLKLGDAEGPPVVFIHGFGGDLNNWLFNQPALAEKHTTYALDLPGHGGSTKEVGERRRRRDDRGRVRLHAGAWTCPRRHLVGHSLGGGVGLDLALDHPDLVASVTAVAPPGSARRSRWSISTASSAAAAGES